MEKNRLCYISRNYYNLTTAGNKAKTDNESTLVEMGATNLGLHQTINSSKLLAFFLDLAGILRACFLLQKGDVLFLQYPVKKYFSFLCRVARRKGAKTICVIHDLGCFRRRKLTVEEETARLSHCDYIIASNDNMRQWFKKHGMKKPVGALGLFDYRANHFNKKSNSPLHTPHSTPNVVYAGALSMRKNAFIVALSRRQLSFRLTIVGNKDSLQGLNENPNISYQGFMPSEEFIYTIEADFGLVWDGDSLSTCSGNYGEYLRWNSPHKVSFYLRAGLPIIVWREAAVAPIIEQAGAGIAISSLEELNEKLARISPKEMTNMKQNATDMAKRLNEGYFLKEAITQIQELHLCTKITK